MLTTHCSKSFNLFAFPFSLAEVSLSGQDVVIKPLIKADAVLGVVEAAIKTRRAYIRNAQFSNRGHSPYFRNNLSLICPRLYRKFGTYLRFKNRAIRKLCLHVRLKDGEHLFVLWDRLALERTPVALVNLTRSVCGLVVDLIDLTRRHPFVASFGRTASTRRTRSPQHTR